MDRDVEASGERKPRGEKDRPRGAAGEEARRSGTPGDADDREESGYAQPESSAQKAPPAGPRPRE